MANLTIYRIPLILLLLLTLLCGSRAKNQTSSSSFIPPATGFLPVEQTKYRVMTIGGNPISNRRMLAPFQLCLLCKCCAANSGASNCSSMPCCFGIDCQLPDKPFGVCAFVPKTCSCSTCGST
ncbi:uncharacterized protein [Aristolochia californica]|uniref:uncharacterized protein n=1 Tax=Aristolochia californica TaxID=171875 RepID=UPI0035DF6BD1